MQASPQRQLISTGQESTVYRLLLNSANLILKLPREGGKQRYIFEAFAYEQMMLAGATVPTVLFANDDLLLMTALCGQEMDTSERLFTNCNLYERIAHDLALCHNIRLPGFGDPTHEESGSFSGEESDWATYLSRVESTLDNLMPKASLTGEDLHKLRAFWKQQLRNVHLDQGRLVHGDFAMTAIFVNGETYAGLIDFGDALIGDPLMDLAYFRLKEITKPYGVATYKLLVGAYRKATNIPWSSAVDDTILLYMIYWGVRRLQHLSDTALQQAFCDKLHKVAALV